MVSWKSGFNTNLILSLLDNAKRQLDDGGIGFSGVEFTEYTLILHSMLDFDANIPEIEQHRIVNSAIYAIGSKAKISKQLLISECEKEVQDFLQRTPQRFVLVGSISESKNRKLANMRLPEGISITFHHDRPRTYTINDRLAREISSGLVPEHPESYVHLCVFVNARGQFEAFGKAISAFDLIRGIWNFALNKDILFRYSYQDPVINRFLLGPYLTLHHRNGEPTDIYWSKGAYSGPILLFKDVDWEQIKEIEQYIRRRLKILKYSHELSDAFIDYGRALDERDLHIAYIKLWSVLERLLLRRNERAEELIKRIAFLDSNHEISREMIKHLKEFRNRFVHRTEYSNEVDGMLHQLNRVVINVFIFLLNNAFGFLSMEEVREFLSLSIKKHDLEHGIKIRRQAIRYL